MIRRGAGASGGAARTPFVLLIVVLLAGGLVALLLLNSALNEGSFRLSELQKETTRLTDEEQALQQEVDSYSDPRRLADRARELGMVPGSNPAFLGPDGEVLGSPGTATEPPPPSPPAVPPGKPGEPRLSPSAQAAPGVYGGRHGDGAGDGHGDGAAHKDAGRGGDGRQEPGATRR